MQKGCHLLVGALLVLAYFAGLPAHVWQAVPDFEVPTTAPVIPQPSGQWQEIVASDAATLLVHAAALAELPDGRLRALWFAGTREGAADVTINTALFDPRSGRWSEERPIVSRALMMDGLGRYVRKLGNAVLSVDEDGSLRLFVVTVSFAGWGASRIAVLHSDDFGETWGAPALLVTSPFVNISNLVKGTPIRFADGTIGLPIYHEFIGKFGELLRLDGDNRVLGKSRIGRGRAAIQPVLVIDSPTQASAFLRNEMSDTSGGVWRSDTVDGGDTWSPIFAAGLDNPSSALSTVQLAPEHWLLAANCNVQERDDLCVQETRDAGETWQRLKTFHDRVQYRAEKVPSAIFRQQLADEISGNPGVPDLTRVLDHAERNKCRKGLCEFQYDYPFMLRARNGDIHILYTWNKTLTRHFWWRAPSAEGGQ